MLTNRFRFSWEDFDGEVCFGVPLFVLMLMKRREKRTTSKNELLDKRPEVGCGLYYATHSRSAQNNIFPAPGYVWRRRNLIIPAHVCVARRIPWALHTYIHTSRATLSRSLFICGLIDQWMGARCGRPSPAEVRTLGGRGRVEPESW
jgi:hypothetical protein